MSEVKLFPCKNCGGTDIKLFEFGNCSYKGGGGKCNTCKHEGVTNSLGFLGATKSHLSHIWNSANKVTQAEKDAATIADLRAELEDLKSRPVCVIVPPIEWGEWKDSEDGINRWKRAKCGRYDIHHDKVLNEYESFLDRTDGAINNVDEGTEQEAEEACQAHAQAKVNAALKGCKTESFRDPQGLVDDIKKVEAECEAYFVANDGDMVKQLAACFVYKNKVNKLVKEWEDGI